MEHGPTIVLTGGGTGGHLFPGLALARELQNQRPGTQCWFVTGQRAIETKILEAGPFPSRGLPIQPLAAFRHRPFATASNYWRALSLARQWLCEWKPAAVIGLGGYASAPILWLAQQRRLPTFLVEQNSVAGRATRTFAKRAKCVFLSFDAAVATLPAGTRTLTVGTPVRREILDMCNPVSSRELPPVELTPLRVLVLGGSQGAHSLNEAFSRMVVDHATGFRNVAITHQSGEQDAPSLRQRYDAAGVAVDVTPFIADMAAAYARCDLVVSRAGATTVAELCCLGKASILVPYPGSIHDHQVANARALADRGAAAIVVDSPQSQITALGLWETMRTLLASPAQRQSLEQRSLELAKPHASESAARVIWETLDSARD